MTIRTFSSFNQIPSTKYFVTFCKLYLLTSHFNIFVVISVDTRAAFSEQLCFHSILRLCKKTSVNYYICNFRKKYDLGLNPWNFNLFFPIFHNIFSFPHLIPGMKIVACVTQFSALSFFRIIWLKNFYACLLSEQIFLDFSNENLRTFSWKCATFPTHLL